MQIDYELTQRDFTESFAAHRDRSVWSRWFRRIFVGVIGIIGVAVIFLFVVSHNAQTGNDLLRLVGLILFWFLLLVLLPKWNAYRQFSKQPRARGQKTVLFDASGAHWRWNGGSTDAEWSNYIRVVEGKKQFLLYTSPACFNIIPKRALDEEQLKEARTLFAQNIRTANN